MEWILDHLQIVIAVAAAIAYWLNQRRQAQLGDDEEDRTESPQRDFNSDPEEEARTRRIQEEIRRKIAERARGGPITVPPPAPEPPPLFRTETSSPRPVAAPLPQREFTRQAAPPPFQASAAAILERQRELEEQMRELEATRKAAQRRAALVAANTAVFAPVAASERNVGLLADLHGGRNLRRAIVLREILGPPVGLR
jgi:hypothetical protein